MPFDPQEFGDDHFFVKQDGIIVGFFASSGRTAKQLAKSAPVTSYFVPWTEEDALVYEGHPSIIVNSPDIIHLCGASPAAALEALRRKEPKVAAKVKDGTLPMWMLRIERIEIE